MGREEEEKTQEIFSSSLSPSSSSPAARGFISRPHLEVSPLPPSFLSAAAWGMMIAEITSFASKWVALYDARFSAPSPSSEENAQGCQTLWGLHSSSTSSLCQGCHHKWGKKSLRPDSKALLCCLQGEGKVAHTICLFTEKRRESEEKSFVLRREGQCIGMVCCNRCLHGCSQFVHALVQNNLFPITLLLFQSSFIPFVSTGVDDAMELSSKKK